MSRIHAYKRNSMGCGEKADEDGEEGSQPNWSYYKTLPRSRRRRKVYDLYGEVGDNVQLPYNTQSPSQNGLAASSSSSSPSLILQDKMLRLEVDKENLLLQVTVLNQQIDAQEVKIRDLEDALTSLVRHSHMGASQRELLARSAAETHKLDLMAENSNLKLRLATLEKDKHEANERLAVAQRRIDELQSCLNDKKGEVSDLRLRLVRNGPSSVPSSPERTDSFRDKSMDKEKTLERLKRKHNEVDKLKKAVDCLMLANEEKDRHIDELGKLLKNYRKMEDLVLSGQTTKDHLSVDDTLSDSSSNRSATNKDAAQLQQERLSEYEGVVRLQHPSMPYPGATSTPLNHQTRSPHQNGNQPVSPISSSGLSTPHKSPLPRSNSLENINPAASKTSSSDPFKGPNYGTLPKNARLNQESKSSYHRVYNTSHSFGSASSHTSPSRGSRGKWKWDSDSDHNPAMPSTLPKIDTITQRPPLPQRVPERVVQPVSYRRDSPVRGGDKVQQALPPPRKSRPFMSFGKGFFRVRSGRWSSSAPNLAQTETDDETLKDEMALEYKALQEQGLQVPPPLQRKKSKGLKRLFGKLRRSSSQDLDKENMEEFKRNALRSTAGGRLCINSDSPFTSWDCDRIAMWLHAIGLSMYVGECRRWVKTGQQLLKASDHTLEKELGMRNHFHRKKLQLAIQRYAATSPELAALPRALDLLDHNFVTRWLDDVGLPQYKDSFTEARVDGRMLHYLSVEDLVLLRVSNALHHLSIKRGIEVLRNNEFNQACLKRRPALDEGQLTDCPDEVCLWTNHRVMEWLRSIDLSEYAPNLRGSGVHGGLMVLEPQFSAEMLAAILSIPCSKTLLRRHLSTHFISLIGSQTQQLKRDYEASPSYTPLTPNQKVKLKKHSLFSSHRKTRAGDEDLICPLINGSLTPRSSSEREQSSTQRTTKEGSLPREELYGSSRSGYERYYNDDSSYSHGMSTLSTRLAQDRHLLDDVPTSDV